jgi:uncharacterized protein YdeI (YjbR/CyaY-like superfamily)
MGARSRARSTETAPTPFLSAAAFRAWLGRHGEHTSELWVRFHKKDSGRGGITYPEALDEALCFGWIDGVRKRSDAASYMIRFTPRKPNSKWSAVNVRHVARLEAEGRMRPPGLAAFARRDGKQAGYSFEERPRRLAPAYERRLRAERRAWTFFQEQAPWYRRTSIFWVMSARKDETRERRLATLISCSARGEPVPPLRRVAG